LISSNARPLFFALQLAALATVSTQSHSQTL
jgi:hypothetical protein